MLIAGKLDKRVTLQSPGGTQNAVGERTTTWTDVATVWASIRPMSAREALVAAQRQDITTHVIEVRYSSTISAIDGSWRVKYGTRYFTIDGVLNEFEKNAKYILYCTESERNE